ncbi:MAG: UbiA-like polyprenyltransferase [Candidatus Thermoplasmatota archaeon]|nr:UbiA-like polyprenyltransferase [Candidatus Thermoplasmatota archaeon]|tara:strand:- start:499 stop:1350 length:852 start_codon:yes stop_codon:yes gene_type:complete
MGVKEILEFVKIEHTLFSLPFVFIGALTAGDPTFHQLFWILLAGIGARGLAMGLNRIIDRDIDSQNPRTSERHLVTGSMSMNVAWGLCLIFLSMLLFGAWKLNEIAFMMSWLPVLVFFIYPYTKRFTWGCHFWLGLCLALAPAGAWLGIVGGDLGWAAITEFHWYPEIWFISFGVMCWIAAFDFNYALMDIEYDKENGIKSFPAIFGKKLTQKTSILLTFLWFMSFAIADPSDSVVFGIAAGIMALVNIGVITRQEQLKDYQSTLFRASVLTGWVLLAGLVAS